MIDFFMNMAIEEANNAFQENEIPVGCVIVKDKQVLAATHNKVNITQDVTGHAEILAIREASKKLLSKYLVNCDLYVTMEPCPMCLYAISLAKVRRVYFSSYNEKAGAVETSFSLFNCINTYVPEVYGGIQEEKSKKIIKSFFYNIRKG